MLDIKFIRENKDLIQKGAQKKKIDFNVEDLLSVDDRRRALLTSLEEKKSKQNEASDKIAGASNQDERNTLIQEMKDLKDSMKGEEEEFTQVMVEWQKLMVAVPNIPDISVPDGESDADNVEVRTVGDIPEFSFKPRGYMEIMEMHDMLDLERGVKVSGFRGYFLKNELVMLNFAIWQYTMQKLVAKGFTPMIVPSLVRRETLMGSGYIPQGEDDLYKTQDGDYLAGTGEVATMSYYSDEIIELGNSKAKKFLAFSPCFRREAGSHGKNTKGIYRVHEFFKIEQVVLCEADHQLSVALHEEITANAEEMLTELGVPFHVVVNCGADLGLGQVKKYDIEAWIPSENKYGETHSASYFHDFQTRRLNIRYRDQEGKLRFAHSLNNTAFATPRLLISVIENNQLEDGSIKIPEVLRQYMGGRNTISYNSAQSQLSDSDNAEAVN